MGVVAGSESDLGVVPRQAPDFSFRLPAPTPAGTTPLPRDVSFLLFEGISFSELYRADLRAKELGVSAKECLIASGAISEKAYLSALGRRLDAEVVESVATIDARVDLTDAIRQGWCRAQLHDGRNVIVVSSAGVLVRALLDTTPSLRRSSLALMRVCDYRAALTAHFGQRLALDAATCAPEPQSARSGATMAQRLAASLVLLALLVAMILWPTSALLVAPLAFGFFFLGATLVILSACIEGAPVYASRIEENDARLPAYSVLVPLYRESAVITDLVRSLDAIDYPREKLQVLLVVEQHDRETLDALAALSLPPHIGVFVAPPGAPQTKPRAINAAMPFVTGDLVVVYDAEDRPESNQLRAAAAAFALVRRDVACLQARLAIDNTADSWLTRMFTIEYAALFDVVKAGNARLGLPVPLGGTSNHFRVKDLRRVGLWDAWNVTEDADLGIRLALNRMYVDDLPSTTLEEAPNRFRPWLAQRTRWLKGWMQTVITHSRAPVQTCRAMGVVNFLSAVSTSAGIVAGSLGAPFFYVLLALRLTSGEPLGGGGLLDHLADGVLIVLGVSGVLSTFLPALIGLARRKLLSLSPWLILLPFYQLLVSLAAWIALVELIRAPHRWNKTTHGVARTSRSGTLQKQ